MVVDFEIVEQRLDGPNERFVKVEFRPIRGRPLRRPGDFDSNIFHMQLYATGVRLIRTELGQLVTRSGRLISPNIGGDFPGFFPDESPADPWQRETFARNNDAEMAANIEAYWERKLRAQDAGMPFPQHHQSTLNLQVAANADDIGVWSVPSPTSSSQQWVAGGDSSLFNLGGAMRFTNVTVGQSDTINTAALIITPDSTRASQAVNSDVDAEDVDDADAIDSAAEYSSAVRTTAQVAYDGTRSWTVNVEETLTDMAAVVQEIVDRPLWVSGNAMVYFWEDDTTTSANNYFRGYQFNADTARAPKFDIDFTGAAPAGVASQRLRIGMGR